MIPRQQNHLSIHDKHKIHVNDNFNIQKKYDMIERKEEDNNRTRNSFRCKSES